MKLFDATLLHMIVGLPEPSEAAPQHMCLDAGYAYEAIRITLDEGGIQPIFAAAVRKYRRNATFQGAGLLNAPTRG